MLPTYHTYTPQEMQHSARLTPDARPHLGPSPAAGSEAGGGRWSLAALLGRLAGRRGLRGAPGAGTA
jgi:hypothetical protein